MRSHFREDTSSWTDGIPWRRASIGIAGIVLIVDAADHAFTHLLSPGYHLTVEFICATILYVAFTFPRRP